MARCVTLSSSAGDKSSTMASFNSFYGRYILGALQNNAALFAHLLREVPADSPRWGARPDAERFNLREIVAHLLEFDSVMRCRFQRMIREDSPELPNWDEAAAALHYSGHNPKHDLKALIESRSSLAVWLEGLSSDEWNRTGARPRAGTFSVKEGVSLMLGHDSYHLLQVAEWLDATG